MSGVSEKTLGQFAYEIWYRLNNGQSAVNGMILPLWKHMPEKMHKLWDEMADKTAAEAEKRKPVERRTRSRKQSPSS